MPTIVRRSPPVRASPVAREIDRDERVVLRALRRRLLRLLGPALRSTRDRDLPALLDALTAAVEEARAGARRLNDARITRRGERAQQPADPSVPPALAAHACHGAYVGAFAGLAAVGRMALETCPEVQEEDPREPAALALALHLRGALWTLDHAGQVHVFRCRR